MLENREKASFEERLACLFIIEAKQCEYQAKIREEKRVMVNEKVPEIKNKDILYPDLSYKAVGAIYEVWKQLGPAFKESAYQKALEEEFKIRDISFKSQQQIPIFYNKKKIGIYTPDFIIDDRILLEIKCLPSLTLRESK